MRIPKAKVALVAAAFALILSIVPASAQMVVDKNRSFFSPEQQFGFGVNNRGGHIQYALGPAFHLGLNLNLDFQSGQSASETNYEFGPYAKFLFSGDVVKPYAFAALGVIQPGTGKFEALKRGDSSMLNVELPESQLSVTLALGAEHFFNQNVGVYGHVNLLDAHISPSPSVVQVGLRGGVAGVEFFF